MKYILCGVAALSLVYPFLSQSTVLAPEPTLEELTEGAMIVGRRSFGGGAHALTSDGKCVEVPVEREFVKQTVYDNGLVVSYRADGSFDYFYQEGN